MRAPHYGHALSRTSLVKVSLHHVFITIVVSVLNLAHEQYTQDVLNGSADQACGGLAQFS